MGLNLENVIFRKHMNGRISWTTRAFFKSMGPFRRREKVCNSTSCSPITYSAYLEEAKPLFTVPTIRDYYVDLDYLLGVIADGPTKSFAYRRLKYLQAKWGMYTLLHEHAELDQMKVSYL